MSRLGSEPPNVDQLHQKRDVQGLIAARGNREAEVRRAAADALGKLGGAEAELALSEWRAREQRR